MPTSKKNTTLDDLAIMIGKGFSEVHKKFDEVNERIYKLENKVDEGFLHVNARLDKLVRIKAI